MQTITKATVESVKKITEDIYEFILLPEKYRKFESGQFLQLSLDLVTASDIWPDSRPFSIASKWDKASAKMRLLIKKNGHFTQKMFSELSVGSECTIKYAFGDMILPTADVTSPVVMIAGGTGIAPFLSFIEKVQFSNNSPFKLFYSVKTVTELIDLDLIIEHLGLENVKIYCTREEHQGFENKRISIEDITLGFDLDKTQYYICGSKPFINDFKSALESKNTKNIFIDEWE